MGVLRNFTKTPNTKEVRKIPSAANRVNAIPKGSVQERYSICLRMQDVWFSLDQESGGHLKHSLASFKEKKKIQGSETSFLLAMRVIKIL